MVAKLDIRPQANEPELQDLMTRLVLQKLRLEIEARTGSPVIQTVLAVSDPHLQLWATRKAAERAGLRVLTMVGPSEAADRAPGADPDEARPEERSPKP